MVLNSAQELTEYLFDRIGDGLRTIVIVQQEGWKMQYLRDDLQEDYTEETYSEVVDTFRLEEPFLTPGIESRPVGERRAIVHYHENAFVIQIPVSEGESILVSLTRDAGRNLLTFVDDCRQVVNDNL